MFGGVRVHLWRMSAIPSRACVAISSLQRVETAEVKSRLSFRRLFSSLALVITLPDHKQRLPLGAMTSPPPRNSTSRSVALSLAPAAPPSLTLSLLPTWVRLPARLLAQPRAARTATTSCSCSTRSKLTRPRPALPRPRRRPRMSRAPRPTRPSDKLPQVLPQLQLVQPAPLATPLPQATSINRPHPRPPRPSPSSTFSTRLPKGHRPLPTTNLPQPDSVAARVGRA